jgi:hypothetical protein
MRQREFITLLGGAAASSLAWPPEASAQERMPTIGFLGVSTTASWTHWTAAFVRRLGESAGPMAATWHRVPLGGGPRRALYLDRGRVRPPQG